ncbi:cytochrome c oxidase subunit IV [Sporobolomyces salmoneus]|uniref:cytochrome c oxidase subunit IV n=1 Tax=Sporobolomyces salmoneus TaxID=183962 RepID=UPI00316E9B8E
MFSRVALRAVAPRALPRVQPARTFLTSLPRFSDAEPTVLGPGGKTGQVPTDIEQATGLERFELLHKLKGQEAFSLEPLQMDRLGTLDDPIMVFSLDKERIVGCTGYPVDSHDTILFPVGAEKPTRCPECGSAFLADVSQGIHGEHHGEHHH